ncbi:hypothetical protein F7734_37850 [Scytonema sp. UIC 10036]|uniref:hypothetical protein n=1 Tax=Scytonema sp. UIC 10036 TaxID=2304196 RepID=UPI0012DAB5C2|nr:hypothetical protein [Scytonema sp. UIC 10036]MUG97767.1 hypothetical protein [Scytonema sp. UIC 10036]
MTEYLSISKQKPEFPPYLNFQTLRDIGITHLQSLSGKLWTDYNLHDPGVTILEVLCYAVTDLGYRNNLDIEDLLALNPGDTKSRENNFFTPDRVLTCNPVTELDLRKRLIDIPGVRNAWLQKVTHYQPAIYVNLKNKVLQYTQPEEKPLPLNLRGLYTVSLDLDPEYRKNACGQLYRSWGETLDEVKEVLCSARNLCEDFDDILILGEEEIALCADIQLTTDADAEDVLVNIYVRIQEFLSPRLRFYTLQELLDKGKSPAEIFAGRPTVFENGKILYESHGFIDTDELVALTLPSILHVSDLYKEILQVPGVAAVKKLSIANYINGLRQSVGHPWYLHLTEKYRPVLGVKVSKINFSKSTLPIAVDLEEVERRYYEQQAAYIKTPRDRQELDLSVPKGSYYELADYYSIQHEFPVTYGIGEEGLPTNVPALRQAQALQLKGYLVFFDQLLAGYLAQLAHIRDLFSWETDAEQRTYFTQKIEFPEVKDKKVLSDNYINVLHEEVEVYRDRRNRFLDHLLARFAESFTDYVLLNYQIFATHNDKVDREAEIIRDKAKFFQDYPALSHDRFRAFNYCDCEAVWDTENVAGLKKRVSRLLGIDDVRRRHLNHYRVSTDTRNLVLSVNVSNDELPLTSQQRYATSEQALADREKFLLFALHGNFYQRLTYQYYYHYGLEVLDTDCTTVLVNSDRYFPSTKELLVAFEPLLQSLLTRLSNLDDTALQQLVVVQPAAEDLFSFRLQIPGENSEVITFTGVQRYFSRVEALTHGVTSLRQIQDKQNYRKITFGKENQLGTAEKFTYYGYALIDEQKKVLAEYTQRFSTESDRDLALQRWLSHIQANQNEYKLTVLTSDGYVFVLTDNASYQPLLRSVNSYSTKLLAWQAAEQFAENLRFWNRYVTVQNGSLGITDKTGNLLAVFTNDRDRSTVFQRLNAMEPFLVIADERYRLVDRQGAIMLESMETYKDVNTARDRFYQDVLGVLFEPNAIQSINSKQGFSFRILSRPREDRSAVAIHPQTYTSADARDEAIEHLLLLVRTARLHTEIKTIEKKPYIGEIYNPENQLLLQTTQSYTTADDAWKQGNTLMELAQKQENYRLIDSQDSIYGWELTNESKDQIFASQYYNSKSDRTQAMESLQTWTNDEGFHVLEHILLRPKTKLPNLTAGEIPTISDDFLPILVTEEDAETQPDNPYRLARHDPYSFWVSIIIPYWPERFRNIPFRRFVEQTLRLEAPAHIVLKIAWVNVQQMHDFESAYRNWLEQLALESCENAACDLTGTLNRLLEILPKLRNVYPQATLHDCEESSPDTNPAILNQTALGTAGD